MTDKTAKHIRFAIYTRYSSEMQSEVSNEAQEKRCRETIVSDKYKGVIMQVYSDSAKSGWRLDRPGLTALRKDAAKGKFDAIMMWKFDRLGRDSLRVMTLKALFRHEYGLKLFCVEGASEDEDSSQFAGFMENILALVSDWYSKNLSSDTRRGKRQRAENGGYNGSVPPFGYQLVKIADAQEAKLDAGLHPILDERLLVKTVFEMYATGSHSHNDIAEWLNNQPYIQNIRRDKQPFNKETIRDMLINKTYTGRVGYAETKYSGTLGQGKKSSRGKKIWFEGKHTAIISDELFEKCQDAGRHRSKNRKSSKHVHTYILKDIVYCTRCVSEKPANLVDYRYGKMRAKWDKRRDDGEYRCIARDRGYAKCKQKTVSESQINDQVINALQNLKIPVGFRDRVESAVREQVEHEDALRQMEEIRGIIERIEFSWEEGFMAQEAYVQKRKDLQRQLESLRPIECDDLMEAADLIENFVSYWNQCEKFENPAEARQQLLSKIIDRIFVYDDIVVAIALHGDFNVILDDETMLPTEVFDTLKGTLNDTQAIESKSGNITKNVSAHYGSDGI